MLCTILRGIAALALLLTGPALAQGVKPELLLYCGATMERPMAEIAQIFEKRENVNIFIAQGNAKDLYQSARKNGIGDWYLTAEPSFRAKYLKEGLLGDFVTVGYNRMALMVQKGNPKRVKADPRELLRKDLTVILGSATSGGVGKEAKDILDGLGIYPRVVKAATLLTPDSRGLVAALKKEEADLTMNWRAVGFFADNVAAVDVIDLDPKLARPQAIEISLLVSTKNPKLARRFMTLAAGEEGQAIFRKYGFLDNKMAVSP